MLVYQLSTKDFDCSEKYRYTMSEEYFNLDSAFKDKALVLNCDDKPLMNSHLMDRLDEGFVLRSNVIDSQIPAINSVYQESLKVLDYYQHLNRFKEIKSFNDLQELFKNDRLFLKTKTKTDFCSRVYCKSEFKDFLQSEGKIYYKCVKHIGYDGRVYAEPNEMTYSIAHFVELKDLIASEVLNIDTDNFNFKNNRRIFVYKHKILGDYPEFQKTIEAFFDFYDSFCIDFSRDLDTQEWYIVELNPFPQSGLYGYHDINQMLYLISTEFKF